MDKNTITGFVLIAALLIGFSWYNKPSDEEIAACTNNCINELFVWNESGIIFYTDRNNFKYYIDNTFSFRDIVIERIR